MTCSDSKISEETKSSLILTKEQSFAEAATKACKAIVDGAARAGASRVDGLPSLFPSTPSEACYVVDDIIITSISEKNGVMSIEDCNEEVSSTRFLNGAGVKDLYTSLVTVVDYKGHRFLAQSAIPGIIHVRAVAGVSPLTPCRWPRPA